MSVPDSRLGVRPEAVRTIRDARPSDTTAIRALLTAAYHEAFHTLPRMVLDSYVSMFVHADGQHRLVVTEIDGRVCGVGRFATTVEDGGLVARGLFVHPGARRLAVVQSLIAHGESLASSLGARGFRFEIPSFMPGTPHLYRILGYARGACSDLRAGLGLAHPVPLTAYWYARPTAGVG